MRTLRRALVAVPAIPAAAAGFVLAQVFRAAHRSDLPSFPNQDPSGTFGGPDSPPLRLVALGDSSITAPGVRNLDNCWVRRVAIDLARTHHVELISVAVGGAKAHDVIEGQLAEATRLKPDIAIVSVGANDSIRGVRARSYRDRLTHIVGSLEKVAGGVVVLGVGDMGSIPRLPQTLRPLLTRRSRLFNAVAAEVAAQAPRTVKVYAKGKMSTAFWEDPTLFADDQFHVSDEGHAIFAEQALPAVRAAIAMAGLPA